MRVERVRHQFATVAWCAPPPAGVQVTGWLQAGEEARIGVDLPMGHVSAISSAQLVNIWGGPMYAGYVLDSGARSVTTDASSGMDNPTSMPLPQSNGGLNLQNLLYALEWWVFAGCAALLWLRSVRDATGNRLAEAATA